MQGGEVINRGMSQPVAKSSGIVISVLSLACRPLDITCLYSDFMQAEKNALTIAFGSVVRELRQGAGLSQEAFASHCQLHRTYIGAVERGEKNVTIATAKTIATALGIPLSQLIQYVEHKLDERNSK